MIQEKNLLLKDGNHLGWRRPVVMMRQMNADFHHSAQVCVPENFSAYIEVTENGKT